jgi:hypothetical protein
MKPIRDVADASQALEATLLRQMLRDSKVFSGHGGPGSEIHSEMFVDALANAVETAGGVGLAHLVEKSLPSPDDGSVPAGTTRPENASPPPLSLNGERNRAELLYVNSRPELAKGDWP